MFRQTPLPPLVEMKKMKKGGLLLYGLYQQSIYRYTGEAATGEEKKLRFGFISHQNRV